MELVAEVDRRKPFTAGSSAGDSHDAEAGPVAVKIWPGAGAAAVPTLTTDDPVRMLDAIRSSDNRVSLPTHSVVDVEPVGIQPNASLPVPSAFGIAFAAAVATATSSPPPCLCCVACATGF